MYRHLRIICITMAVILLGASLLNAQIPNKSEKMIWPTYYSTSDPGDTPLDQAPWQAIVGPINAGTQTNIWFGTENVYVKMNTKYYELRLNGINIDKLASPVGTGYYRDTIPGNPNDSMTYSVSPVGTPTIGMDDPDLVINAIFKPQPGWEVIRLTNGSTVDVVTISQVTGSSQCVPSGSALSTIGIIGLVVLLVAATVVIWRRKKTASIA